MYVIQKRARKKMLRRSRGYFLAIHFFASALFGLTLASKANAEDDDDGSVVGTWIITAELAPGFVETEFTIVNPGGTMTLTSSVFNPHSSLDPFLPPFLVVDISDGYGRLRREGASNRFAGTFKRLLFAGARTDPNLYGEFFVGQSVLPRFSSFSPYDMVRVGTRWMALSLSKLETFGTRWWAPAAERLPLSVSTSSR